ncbi:MAG: tail fiber domain-containing protein [Acidovorax temperans]|uniref:tail fiber domain-containing protein n=1 Tax=Acidovorax temperans TaxID=80878 RepID=UPI00391A9C18
MPTQNVPNMTPVPAFPALSERAAGTYNASAYAFGTHMSATFNSQLLAVANNVKYNADDAKVSADAAALSATAAAASKAEAESSAFAANASKVDAAASKTAAASSAASALTSKNAAEAASSEALGHRNAAKLWADSLSGEIEPGKYSARYWAEMSANAVLGGVVYMGAWDASSGVFPPSPKRGHLYRVSTSGSVAGQSYSAGDSIIYGGSSWDKIDSTDQVTTVAGRVGDIVLSKSDVGLGNVDNTSDANKPVSAATQTALDGKANTSHTHAVADVTGLQTALDGKAASSHTHAIANVTGLQTALDGKAPLTGGGTSGTWPISITGNATQTVQQTAGKSAVQQSGDIGSMFVSWSSDAVPAVQVDAPRSDAAYMIWRATRWGVRHIAAMHVYEGNMTVTMSVGANQNYTWDSNGNFQATGNITAYSDIRLKTDLTKITDALSKVSRLNGYTYTRKDTGQRQTGVVAQEVQEVLPEAVIDNGEHLAVAYGNLVGLLIEAIKELKSEVDQLKGK